MGLTILIVFCLPVTTIYSGLGPRRKGIRTLPLPRARLGRRPLQNQVRCQVSLSFDVSVQPGSEGGFIEGSGREAHHCLCGMFFVGGQTIAVQFEKQDADEKAGALVSVYKRVVSDDTGCIGGGQRNSARTVAIRVHLMRPSESRFEQSFVAHPRRAAVEGQETIMKREGVAL